MSKTIKIEIVLDLAEGVSAADAVAAVSDWVKECNEDWDGSPLAAVINDLTGIGDDDGEPLFEASDVFVKENDDE